MPHRMAPVNHPMSGGAFRRGTGSAARHLDNQTFLGLCRRALVCFKAFAQLAMQPRSPTAGETTETTTGVFNILKKTLEVTAGIEPAYADLQSAA